VASGTACDRGAIRPDLRIPLVQTSLATARGLTGLREPTFDLARKRNSQLVGAAAALLAVGQVVVVDPLRAPVTSLALVFAAYAVLRAVSLTLLERRQRAFEPTWLAERSVTLSGTEFELIRLVAAERVYDLTDASNIAALLRLADGGIRLEIGFRYAMASAEWVIRRLREVRIEAALRPGTTPRVRFPSARYAVAPSSRRTFWSLGAPVLIIVAAPADLEATRGETGSAVQPPAERRPDARPPETT
jgi:hypothetical protein